MPRQRDSHAVVLGQALSAPAHSQLDLDLMTAVARIEQLAREGPDSCSGLILDRLITCDGPRLRRHVDPDFMQWADDASR